MRYQYVATRPAWATQVLLELARRDISQRQFAARIGISSAHLFVLLSRPGHMPKMETIYRIATALDYNPLELAQAIAAEEMQHYLQSQVGGTGPTETVTPRPANLDSETSTAP